jgi:capsule polysaccharide export protein KpsE/RkpR
LLFALLIPNRYESTARLMPPDTQSGNGVALLAALAGKGGGTGGGLGGGLGAVAGDLLGIKSTSAVFIGVLRSQTVEDRLIERFNLKHVYWIKTDEDARNKLESRSTISEDRKSGIITIEVEDRSSQRAAAIAQGYIEELNKLVVNLSTSSAHRERVFLEERLIKVKSELDQSSEDFSQFASKNKALEIKEEARAMLQGAAALEGELIAAQSQLQGLRAIYTDNNVRVRSLQSRITELQRQLAKMAGKTTDGPSSTANGSGSSTDAMLPSMRNLPLLGVKYADLYRRMQINEAVFETLTQQYELARVQEAKETPTVRVLDSAKVPEKKSFPPRLLIVLLCGGLVFCGAIFLVVGRARWEKIEATDPGKVLASEVFHSVHSMMPWATPNGSRFQAMTNRVWTKLVKRGNNTDTEN